MEEDELEAARVKAAAERRDHGRKRIYCMRGVDIRHV
jgi:hypothetical protein